MRRILVCVVILLAALAGQAMAQLPPGFEEVTLLSNLPKPTAFAFAPDGRLFICMHGGRLRVYAQGQLLEDDFVDINVTFDSEQGLLGIAFDPDFASNHYVYVYYTTSALSINPPPSPRNRVSRLTADGNRAVPGSETIILDNIPSSGVHNAGCLRFGLDGKLYISTGDAGTRANSQDLSNLAGKILRINKDGSVPEDNPFVGQADKRPEIYCYGLRNPFRYCFRPGTNTLYIADVGQGAWEEVNVGQPGGNYGWPIHEGPSDASGFISPLYAYEHAGQGASITGGVFLTSTNYPAEFQGSYYFGDFVRKWIKRLVVSADNRLLQVADFGPAVHPVDFAQGPDGNLYYLSYSTFETPESGSVRVIRYLAALSALNLPATIPGCKTAIGKIVLDRPAPAGGALVELISTNPAAVVPGSVLIPEGKTVKSFKITTVPVATTQTGDVTATYNDSSLSRPLKVRPIGVKSVKLTPNPVVGGNSVTGTVTLECPAAPGDIVVSLSSQNPAVANPTAASITIPQGQTTGAFTVATADVSTIRYAVIKAKANGITKHRKLTVHP